MQGQWVHGIVDEVQWDRDTGLVTIIEHKTRGRPSLPSAAQQATAHLQASIYRALLEGLRTLNVAEVGCNAVWATDQKIRIIVSRFWMPKSF